MGQRWGVPEGLHLGLRTGVGSTDRLSTNAPTVRNPQRVRVVLGAHRLQTPEPTQQRLGISRLFENNYNPQEKLNDVLLLQVGGRCLRCAPPSSASRCRPEAEPGTNFGVCGDPPSRPHPPHGLCRAVSPTPSLHCSQIPSPLASQIAQWIKNHPPAMQEMREMRVQSLGLEDPLEEGMATHSSTLAWRSPWTEEPAGLRSMQLQRVGHDWINLAQHNAATGAPEAGSGSSAVSQAWRKG